MSKSITLFGLCIPCYFFTRAVNDFEKLKQYIRITARIIVITMSIEYLIFQFILEWTWGDNIMGFSYMLLPGVIGEMYFYFEEKKADNLIFFLISFILLVINGSRGPLLGVMVYVLLYILINIKHKFFTVVLLSVITIPIIPFFVSNYYKAVMFINIF